MADEEHIRIIKKGVKFWNKWRSKHQDIIPDLSESTLRNIELHSANLSGADLFKVDFSWADLSGTDLSNADLLKTNLSGVNLNGARLDGADIRNSELCGASLRFAHITNVDFTNARLSQTDLSYSDLEDTLLNDATLTGANLHNSNRKGWKIHNAKCNYIFFDEQAKERQPKNRDFEPNEFERLYKSTSTIELIFPKHKDSIDPVVLNFIIPQIHTEHPELGLDLSSIEQQDSYLKATFSVAIEEVKEFAQELIKTKYTIEDKNLKEDKDRTTQIITSLKR